MGVQECLDNRRDSRKCRFISALGHLQGNSFVPWTNLELGSSQSAVSLQFSDVVHLHVLKNSLPGKDLSARPVKSSTALRTFIPSVLEDEYRFPYKVVDKPSASSQWIPPLYSQSVDYYYKYHKITVEPLTTIFIGRSFQLLLLRQVLLHLGPYLEDQLVRLERENPEDEDNSDEELEMSEEKKPAPSIGPPLELDVQARKCGWAILREIAGIATRRTLGFWATEHMRRRTAWKLTKDLSDSAVRKSARGLGRFTVSQRMFSTAFRGYFLTVTASFLVQLAIDTYTCAKHGASPQALHTLVDKTTKSTFKSIGYLIAAAVGASIGTLLWPGRGTFVGLLGGTLAAEYIFPVLEKYIKDMPNGGGLDFAPL